MFKKQTGMSADDTNKHKTQKQCVDAVTNMWLTDDRRKSESFWVNRKLKVVFRFDEKKIAVELKFANICSLEQHML